MTDLLLSFYGDDFTGSTDAMESLARAGLRTVLFTAPPTPEQLTRYPGLRAFGVAGRTRSMPPDEMERALRPALEAMKRAGAPIVHYKVCSTFDSSPTVGSIGRAIEIGAEVFEAPVVPVVVGAPSLGRYCVFGNLFARAGSESEPHRLDRHPSMSHHPTTPMDEADLRLHLGRQTSKTIGLIDVLKLEGTHPGTLADAGAQVVLIDLLHEHHLPRVGALVASARFAVGSSSVESALAAHWKRETITFPAVGDAGPLLAVCGSCSPVTAAQVEWAGEHGFVDVSLSDETAAGDATAALRSGRSVALHSRRTAAGHDIGVVLGRITRDVLAAKTTHRLLVAGGDTSGSVAHALGIESLDMIGELTRGAPLCRAAAPGSPADGIEVTFKGGQIGPVDFFGRVRMGAPHG